MIRLRRLALAAALVAASAQAAAGQGPAGHAPGSLPAGGEEVHFEVGEELAKTLTLVTGVPISPLLGVSGLGAWRYFSTPEALRPALPWYARPWFWGSGLALVFLFVANTTLGAAVPGLKKPMDFVEEHENKLSALLATPIVLLEAKRLIERSGLLAALPDGFGPRFAEGGVALVGGVDPLVRPLVEIGLGALSVACFAVVFLAFHAVQVLIALSPSVLLDMLLRGFRLSVLAAVACASGLHPYLGAALGFAILLLSWLIAAWSFRLTVYGSVLSWDFLAGRAGQADPATAPLAAFAARGLAGVPTRSYGRLEAAPGGGWRFHWRPWLVFRARAVELGAGGGRLALRRGTISPLLFRAGVVREPALVRFPPRFRGREEGLAGRLGVAEVVDGRVVRGLKAAWRWLRELASGSEPAETPAG